MLIIAILLLIIIFILLYIVIHMKIGKTNKSNENISPHQTSQPLKEHVTNTSDKKSSAHTSKSTVSKSGNKSAERKTLKMKWRNRMLDISMIPKSVELDKNTLLPQSIKRKYAYGRRFNSFVAYNDAFFYHRSTCSNIQGSQRQTVHRYIALQKMLPCPNCKPADLIDEWYIEFLKVNFGVDINYNEFSSQLGLPMINLPEHEKLKIIDENCSQG